MATVNRVFLIGRLGAAPEGRTTPAGARMCTFSLATDRPSRDKDGVTDWHRVVAWERTAEQCEAYLDKGHLVAVEGSVQYSQWKTQDGQPRKSAEVRARVVHFLSPRARGEDRRGVGGAWSSHRRALLREGGPGQARGPERPRVTAGGEGASDDLPF